MLSQIQACLYKQVCEAKNNIKKNVISLGINVIILLMAFFRTMNSDFLGLDYNTIVLVYIVVWTVMMSFTLVNDIIIATNNEGILEQIFLSSCSISRFTNIQILFKGLYSMVFITIVFTISSIFSKTLSIDVIISMLITLVIGVMSILGIGYLISCLAIVTNNRSVSMLLRLLLLAIIIRSEESIWVPFSICKIFLTDLIINKHYLWQQDNSDIVLFILNSTVYFLAGIIIFRLLTTKKLRVQSDF
jgi:hypothetical protein